MISILPMWIEQTGKETLTVRAEHLKNDREKDFLTANWAREFHTRNSAKSLIRELILSDIFKEKNTNNYFFPLLLIEGRVKNFSELKEITDLLIPKCCKGLWKREKIILKYNNRTFLVSNLKNSLQILLLVDCHIDVFSRGNDIVLRSDKSTHNAMCCYQDLVSFMRNTALEFTAERIRLISWAL